METGAQLVRGTPTFAERAAATHRFLGGHEYLVETVAFLPAIVVMAILFRFLKNRLNGSILHVGSCGRRNELCGR